jgi:uncharacterized protein (TIGR00725 family)
MKRPIIGVMGGGRADERALAAAHRLGGLIAAQGWTLLNGGRAAGIMEASARGAKEQGGLTIGILPDDRPGGASQYIDIPILTGIGDARNYVNVLSSDVVVACVGKAGTLSEISLALKNRRRVVLLDFDIGAVFDSYKEEGLLFEATTPEEAIEQIKQLL